MPTDDFLAELGPGDRATLESLLVRRRHRRGEIAIAQSDRSADVFFVLSGLARATIYSEEGRMVAYRDIGPGAIFGELSAIDGAPRSASVVAVDDLVTGRLPAADFRRLVETMPAFTWALLRYLSAQSRRMTERIFEFSTMIVRDRLVQELIRLTAAAGAAEGPVEISPPPTHFELAARISTHREAVSREMSRLARKGLIARSGRRLVILDVAGLRELQNPGQ